ncbi:ABC-2 type transport system permease protein [Scopulibacillus darangshiensis]|uniref:ABC-2 type transport system permease protein n=1 Tax=Scopulibacillus darangshiensis TaxID=442528 RepID=A0A4R2P4M5_9BACL|nr:ABC transporter permease [Scopulibacillus darangshiensis]TCP29014.1 ABC-2 type transport system permease protein [Scopulibacillus darangshiensis]
MNIFNIAMKEIKGNFRDIRTLVFMLAFPIVLMLVLGTALSSTFTTHINVDDINVLYKDTAGGHVTPYFNEFIKTAEKSGIHFKKAASDVDGKKEVKQGDYTGYVEIDQNGMQLYLNKRNSIEGSILQGALTSFADKYNVATVVAKAAPSKVGSALSSGKHDDYIKESSLSPNKQPGAMDYYAIAMTTMIALYSAISASNLFQSERVRRTADRLIASPVRKSEIFIGKVLGNIGVNLVCILLVVTISKLFFKANWGDHLGVVLLVLLTEIVFAVSLGLGISYLTKTGAGPRVIVMLIIQVASFFGGAYFKIENPEGIMKFLTDLSPLTWINEAINNIIYANDLSAAIPAVTFNIGLSILFLLVAIISLRKREGL